MYLRNKKLKSIIKSDREILRLKENLAFLNCANAILVLVILGVFKLSENFDANSLITSLCVVIDVPSVAIVGCNSIEAIDTEKKKRKRIKEIKQKFNEDNDMER